MNVCVCVCVGYTTRTGSTWSLFVCVCVCVRALHPRPLQVLLHDQLCPRSLAMEELPSGEATQAPAKRKNGSNPL